jgi:hypothetical protein
MRAMKSPARFAPSSFELVLLLAAPLAACTGGGGTDGGTDASDADVRPRPDFINVNCTSAAGEEDAVNCNARLMSMTGAHFFVGGAAECYPDPSNPACGALCGLEEMNGMNCMFNPTTPDSGPVVGSGCRYSQSEGYRVVVEMPNGNRSSAAVGSDGQCTLVGTSYRKWARVRFDDLTGAAACAASMPAGGFGPPRFESCDTPDAPCGTVSGDTCQTLNFMGPAGMYQANVCTRQCTGDADCGGRGACDNGVCWARCGGACALSCGGGFSCQMGTNTQICLPPAQ